MLSRLFKSINYFSSTIIHPQWLANRVHRKFKKNLGVLRNSLVLDIGSGSSALESYTDNTCDVITLDYPVTAGRYSLLPNIYADACCLPFLDQSFDSVAVFEVLEHIKTPEAMLLEISRVLKPKGKLILSVPFCYPLHDIPHDYWRFSRYGLENLLKSAGLDNCRISATHNPFTTLFQLANLVLLTAVKAMEKKSRIIAFCMAFILYPVCLVVNLISLPFLLITWRGPLSLGYYVEATVEEHNGH